VFMKTQILTSMVAVALLSAAGAANASVVLGSSSPGATLAPPSVAQIPTQLLGPGTFSDNYFFTTSVSTSVGVSVASFEIPTEYSISGLDATLYNSTHTSVDSGQNFLFASLPAGTYEISVMGDAIGPSGGAYAGVVTVNPPRPVPLPAGAWLLLSGLAGIAGVASSTRRRSSAKLSTFCAG
jgi:hypothetical protein